MDNIDLVSFGEATTALKEGKRVARRGWNGKGLFIFMQVPARISVKDIVPKMQSLPQSVKDEFERRYQSEKPYYDKELVKELLESPFSYAYAIKYKNQLAMVYPDNTIYGWVASPSDVLENDWVILDK